MVLGFFAVVLAIVVGMLALAPDLYDEALRLPADVRLAELGFLAALSAFIGVLAVGVVRRWRWTFWLILVAFLFGCSACRWLSCNSPESCVPAPRPGMSCSKG